MATTRRHHLPLFSRAINEPAEYYDAHIHMPGGWGAPKVGGPFHVAFFFSSSSSHHRGLLAQGGSGLSSLPLPWNTVENGFKNLIYFGSVKFLYFLVMQIQARNWFNELDPQENRPQSSLFKLPEFRNVSRLNSDFLNKVSASQENRNEKLLKNLFDRRGFNLTTNQLEMKFFFCHLSIKVQMYTFISHLHLLRQQHLKYVWIRFRQWCHSCHDFPFNSRPLSPLTRNFWLEITTETSFGPCQT